MQEGEEHSIHQIVDEADNIAQIENDLLDDAGETEGMAATDDIREAQAEVLDLLGDVKLKLMEWENNT